MRRERDRGMGLLHVSRRSVLAAAAGAVLPLGLPKGALAASAATVVDLGFTPLGQEEVLPLFGVGMDANLRQGPIELSIWGSADASASEAFQKVELALSFGGGHSFSAWRFERQPGGFLAPIRLTVQPAAEAGPRLHLRGQAGDAQPLELTLPLAPPRGRRGLPLQEGTTHVVLSPPEARRGRLTQLRAVATEESPGQCQGSLACPDQALSPWPGALVIHVRLRALDPVPPTT